MNDNTGENWKNRSYIVGTMLGTLFGAIAAYLYNRAAEEDADLHGGHPVKIQTGQMLGLTLAALGIIRQIAELGKAPKK